MRLLFFGDIVGRAGRDAVLKHLPDLRARLAPDLVVVNGENAAAGFGITAAIAGEFLAAGIDCITTGNHVWSQKELVGAIDRLPRVLRPLNYPEDTPGKGAVLIPLADGRSALVVCLIARLFMDMADDPFAAIERLLKDYRLGAGATDLIFVDFHGEATSEKMAMAHLLDGRVSAVVGTHSHIPTADAWILPGGTAYQTDAGMCGDYNSVIGMKVETSVPRFVRRVPADRMVPAEGEATVCGCFVETDDRTGLALRVEAVRQGGRLSPAMPAV